jgi:hypothetical protein
MKILSNFHWQSSQKYRARLCCDLELDLGMGYPGIHEFCHDSNLWGILRDDRLTIMAGYASDLCSPGFYLFGKWYGTPSKGAELPAFLHDFARQFMRPNVACSPWDRKGSDDLFYNALRMMRHPLAGTYHGAVAGPIGDLWMRLNRPRPETYCRCHE